MTRVINRTTNKPCSAMRLIRTIVRITDKIVEFGYCSATDPLLINCLYKPNEYDLERILLRLTPDMKEYLTFSKQHGMYLLTCCFNDSELIRYTKTLGYGNFPYVLKRYYEAFNSLDLFKNKQIILKPKNYKLAEYFHYTFGVEFETSMGYIPEDICYRDGLIPLRDGSITGVEYSTIVLEGNNGLNLLQQQMDSLKEYTFFNKECALHVHLGLYPINDKSIFTLYVLGCLWEEELSSIVPAYTFTTSKYKASGKDYCKYLPRYSSFNELYEGYTGTNYENKLFLPHPNDQTRDHKWDCHERYYWMNIINLICYDKCKTVEFRFLRPTMNFYKLYLWLYILNGMLLYAEKMAEQLANTSDKDLIRYLRNHAHGFVTVMREVYPSAIADCICQNMVSLGVVVKNQNNNQDYIGKDTFLEDILINEDSIRCLL